MWLEVEELLNLGATNRAACTSFCEWVADLTGELEFDVDADEPPPDLADLDTFLERISALVHRTAASDARIRELAGEFAATCDEATSTEWNEELDMPSIEFRRHLIDLDAAPPGRWRARLLDDELTQAWLAFEDDSFRASGEEAVAALSQRLERLGAECDALIAGTRSRGTLRSLQAIRITVASFHQDDRILNDLLDRWFKLHDEQRRNSPQDRPHLGEITLVVLAGTSFYARAGSADELDEFMRRIRIIAEEPGEVLDHHLLLLWNKALLHFDQPRAHMQVLDLLNRLREDRPDDDSDVLGAAFQLMVVLQTAGDAEGATEVATYWCPVALAAAPSPGSRKWVLAIENS